ncbi:nitrite reductase [Alkalihalobacillus alcalophilus ATCC 27647 = CGMCC 1.3604]|uniref:Nitrite reductase n=1 Tax=Alkalihalobacillus alcalophilus ATCC 27647 = CGMCC 1.3604 TaxID=1218173 RepID=A0A094XCN7_ALKAL|nr:nitrite reductase large subunit NirB [Alkalihalobacillus alcalophilus]KGA96565.1 nitrite reductase [Alkalihalobacillus alcalophilus ATCC 27647 = CGMCC 1.3604]MED1563530.1 nitrite reductase large subunit NirB [Alkalihalobacillus alcalophilus]THG90521.1 nitrite reductase [Alkalihalobacillus alcalophilus ATCC 27647 = CGMCC 1.3604]
MKEKLVLIGNGMAGIRTIEEIIKLEPNRFEITVFGEEPQPNYNRILLSSVLQGDAGVNDIILNDYKWYEENQIQLYTGDPVVSVDSKSQIVKSANGIHQSYDHLIFATGSNAFMLPLPGADKEGVIAFRNIKDCETMIETAKKYKRAVVIGGGLLGLEAARGLLNLKMEVEVIHLQDFLMERQLDRTAAKMLQEELENQGMRFHLNKQTEKLLGGKRVEGLLFKDGTKLETDLVVMAVGIKPNIQLAQKTGLEIGRAIQVNDKLETSQPNVYAVGECAEHRGVVYGLVAPLYEQGKVLAAHICEQSKEQTSQTPGYKGSVVYTQLKVAGVDVFSAGNFIDTENTKSIRVHDEFDRIYKKVVIQDNRILGCVLFGDTSDSPRILSMLRSKEDISKLNKVAILPSEQMGAEKESAVASMLDSETICGCNGVSKGDIVSAINELGLKTVREVTQCTNAARSCGGCKPQVQELIELTTGEEANVAKEPMCTCTHYSHEEVVANIRELGLTFIHEVMNVLNWKSKDGCSKCRPALNYYLGLIDPLNYEDDSHSRFVNERLHANIQNDGTFSVVPRMYGGVTDSAQLRKIADVADRFNVPLLKVTGGQRIDLLGINKEDLPKVWKELDMRSGYAYGKTLRTVKTCVGENFCRFGTQDSIGLGILIEKKYEGLNTPHKVKMAVSACPRNCAESGIKDVGIVGVEGAWEIYVAGNGGVDLRKGDLLCKVQTSEEVINTISAFLQYYREQAKYLERTSHWVERVGLDSIKKVVLEDHEERVALIERMDIALSTYQDPWEELVNSEEKKEKLFKTNLVNLNS